MAAQDRETCVFLAKLAEQAERYDEMVRRRLIDRPRVGCWRGAQSRRPGRRPGRPGGPAALERPTGGGRGPWRPRV